MKDLYISLKEANQGCIPDSLDMKDFAEMHKLKIYNKEHYESWKKSHPENGKIGSENTKNTKKK